LPGPLGCPALPPTPTPHPRRPGPLRPPPPLRRADPPLHPRQALRELRGQPPRLRPVGPLLDRLQHPLALRRGPLRRGEQPAIGRLQRRAALVALAAGDPVQLLR